MKIKDYLLTLSDNVDSQIKGVYGKQLKILEPYFKHFEEFKDKSIEILTDIGEPIFDLNNNLSFKIESNPEIVTVNNFECLKNNIKIYSISLC